MPAISIKLANADGELDIPLELVRHLRLLQDVDITFENAWASPPAFQEVGMSRAQAFCLWELVLYDTTQQTSEYESLLEWECFCDIDEEGVGWVLFTDKELRFTPESRWLIDRSNRPGFQYFFLAAQAVLEMQPPSTSPAE
jgi:hypothetical protein